MGGLRGLIKILKLFSYLYVYQGSCLQTTEINSGALKQRIYLVEELLDSLLELLARYCKAQKSVIKPREAKQQEGKSDQKKRLVWTPMLADTVSHHWKHRSCWSGTLNPAPTCVSRVNAKLSLVSLQHQLQILIPRTRRDDSIGRAQATWRL